eukprot:TRINITY_DN12768_c0_g1_i1.p1 TRINITY_DN12768_c0_g1~~TRINITY_DN12768_c0_g1_i1.p1  ORF type:complete len:120 (+),score=16.21 TRINITY_DN12768_c0_g1_i1:45-404(+)
MSLTVLVRLEAQINKLKHDAKRFDNAKLLDKNRHFRHKQQLFDPHLFSSKSLLLADYVDEISDALTCMPAMTQRNSYTFAVRKKFHCNSKPIVRVLKKPTPVWDKKKPHVLCVDTWPLV